MFGFDHFWFPLILGVAASGAASIIFWLALFRIRPNIAISDKIAKGKTDDNQTAYRIKLVNLSRRAAVDLHVSIFRDTLRNVPDGEVHRLKPLAIRSTPGHMLHSYRKKDPDSRYALRLRIEDDLDAVWTDDDVESLVVRIYARDSMSGAYRHFEHVYRKKSVIKIGSFHKGKSFDVGS
jgi:hypothetical protein